MKTAEKILSIEPEAYFPVFSIDVVRVEDDSTMFDLHNIHDKPFFYINDFLLRCYDINGRCICARNIGSNPEILKYMEMDKKYTLQ